jgi:hypothetical protein
LFPIRALLWVGEVEAGAHTHLDPPYESDDPIRRVRSAGIVITIDEAGEKRQGC